MKWIDPIPFCTRHDRIGATAAASRQVATTEGRAVSGRNCARRLSRATRTRDALLTCRTQAHSHFFRLYPRPDGAARRISQQITVFKIEDNKVNEEEFEQGFRKISNANSKRDVRIPWRNDALRDF